MIKDRLNLQNNTIGLLKEGCILFLETEKKLKLIVRICKEEKK
jgi:hypothetical protein